MKDCTAFVKYYLGLVEHTGLFEFSAREQDIAKQEFLALFTQEERYELTIKHIMFL